MTKWITDFFKGLFGGCWGKAKKKLPDVVKPKPPVENKKQACDCDLSKPLAVPLQQHGSEAEVDEWLRWEGAPECGGMPAGIRYQLLRPSGKSWSYAPMAASGLIQYNADADQITVRCGVFEGQMYHPVYKSKHDQGTHMTGTVITPGFCMPFLGENFIYFQCRNLK